MEKLSIDRAFYEAILNFENDEKSQDYYYEIMDSKTGKVGRDGKEETIRDRVLKVYGLLFCDGTGLKMGYPAGPDEVYYTADRLYIGSVGYDHDHWYRMKYHFPVIDDDNYDRFAALVIADLHSGYLHEVAEKERKMLVVGEPDPLHMTKQQRQNQHVTPISLPGGNA
ncbi:MAG: hypothetical protein IJ695_10135 [Butyrivibrio sp.]|nr:hypothetical protein [Butyrivibrio sp.]